MYHIIYINGYFHGFSLLHQSSSTYRTISPPPVGNRTRQENSKATVGSNSDSTVPEMLICAAFGSGFFGGFRTVGGGWWVGWLGGLVDSIPGGWFLLVHVLKQIREVFFCWVFVGSLENITLRVSTMTRNDWNHTSLRHFSLEIGLRMSRG